VAAAAAVEVHPRAQPFIDFFGRGEISRAGVEEFELVCGQVRERPAGARGSPRTPGSLALKVNWEDAVSIWDRNKAATDPANNEDVTSLRFIFMLVSSLSDPSDHLRPIAVR
jgi:hypothetical protein